MMDHSLFDFHFQLSLLVHHFDLGAVVANLLLRHLKSTRTELNSLHFLTAIALSGSRRLFRHGFVTNHWARVTKKI